MNQGKYADFSDFEPAINQKLCYFAHDPRDATSESAIKVKQDYQVFSQVMSADVGKKRRRSVEKDVSDSTREFGGAPDVVAARQGRLTAPERLEIALVNQMPGMKGEPQA